MATKKADPAVAKGKQFPFEVAVACWVDLLGYGSMISKAGFNPLDVEATKALSRLRSFHRIVATHSTRNYPTLVMNDGAIAYRDLSMRSRVVTYDFVARSFALFSELKKKEIGDGFPGPRMVIAAGFRMRGRRAGLDATVGKFKSIMGRYSEKIITAEQAIHEASAIRRHFDVVPQLQANFAFTKAYLAESSGSGGGLKGPECFIDMALFDNHELPWIKMGPLISWTSTQPKMSATFTRVIELVGGKRPPTGPIGIRDALQVAQHLSNDPKILKLIRSASKPSP